MKRLDEGSGSHHLCQGTWLPGRLLDDGAPAPLSNALLFFALHGGFSNAFHVSHDVGSQAVDAEDFENLKDLHVVEGLSGAAFSGPSHVEVGVL